MFLIVRKRGCVTTYELEAVLVAVSLQLEEDRVAVCLQHQVDPLRVEVEAAAHTVVVKHDDL